nr:unnamed protein product [Callosobruchus analis]
MGNSVDKLNEMLLDHPECGVICVTEHWKSEIQLKMLAIEDSKLISCYSGEEGKYGGALVYSRTFIDCRALPEVCEV